MNWMLWLLVVVAGVWAARRVFSGYPAPATPTRLLTRAEVAFVAAAADAVYPAGGDVPVSGTEARIPEHTDGYVRAIGGTLGTLMRLLFFMMEHATLVFAAPGPGGRRRFSSLSPEQRVAVFEGWAASRLPARRLVFTSLRAILSMGYFACPAVLEQLRLAPYAIESPIVEADLLYPRVGASRDTIGLTGRDLSPEAPAVPLDIDGPLHPDIVAGRHTVWEPNS